MPYKDIESWKQAQKAAKLANYARLYGKKSEISKIEAEIKAKIAEIPEYHPKTGRNAAEKPENAHFSSVYIDSEARMDPELRDKLLAQYGRKEEKGLNPNTAFLRAQKDKRLKRLIDSDPRRQPPPEGYTDWAEVPEDEDELPPEGYNTWEEWEDDQNPEGN